MNEEKSLKRNLIVLSLSPLFFLTLIQYIPFDNVDIILSSIFHFKMICKHMPIFIGCLICVIWLTSSICIYVRFKFYQKYDAKGGYEVCEVNEDKEAGLNFFLALILPLLINDITTWNGLLMMIVLVLIIVELLSKTNLYYQNPVLILLKYRIYKIEFKDNPDMGKEEYIVLIQDGKLENNEFIEYKKIEDNVLLIRRRR